jgi:hypothetical protein
MIWVAWRLERTTLLVLAGMAVVFAAWLVIRGLQLHSIVEATRSCRRPDSPACNGLQGRIGSPTATAGPILLNLLPLVIGMFVGAPMFARDFEAGSQRFALTQGTGRTRRVASRLALAAAVCLPLAELLGLLAWWWLAPYRGPAFFGGGPWISGRELRIVTPVLLTGWTLLGLTVGAAVSMLLRRTVRAIAATGTLLAVLMVLRRCGCGRCCSASIHCACGTARRAGPTRSRRTSPDLTGTFRFWLFQFAELGVLLVVCALLVVLTLRIARRVD